LIEDATKVSSAGVLQILADDHSSLKKRLRRISEMQTSYKSSFVADKRVDKDCPTRSKVSHQDILD